MLMQTQQLPLSASDSAQQCVQGAKRVVYVTIGSLFLALGLVGVVLPGLPTTPFLLLTSYFYARSSPALNQRLLENPLVGPILQNWYEHRGVTLRVKRIAIAMVLAAMAMLVALSSLAWPALASILAIAMFGLLVVYRLPVVPNNETSGC
ncbi:YbaN family protein [Aeoliella mucimassa]|uniref:Inner membrane protein YbaN n=1 Tax=Aeoliella mucimassa TaxID=2527972 RepID=A0A518AM03_9BACT|nr:YbaN family protein [Aeoliella mucimassa]QDU55762.1 Inner membrane protein YbaN [Aeoliella mucimassa]